jgi:chlorobactene glucosyltransferase
MLSLTPQFILNTAWEKITVPVCSALMMVWFQPARVNNPKLPTSYANGAFLMMSRYCYDSLGGWCRFRTEITEDIAIARAVKTSGQKLAVLQTDGIYRTCMYENVHESWKGWSRIFYGALPQKALILSVVRLIVCTIIPTWGLLIGLVASSCGVSFSNEWNGILTAVITAVTLQQIYSYLISRAIGGSLLWSLASPIGHLALAGMLMRALMNHTGIATTQWSGMVIRRGQLVTAPPQTPALSIHTTQAR